MYTITQVASNVRRTEVGGYVFARENVHAWLSTPPSLVERGQEKTEGGRSSFPQDHVQLADEAASPGGG